MSGSTSPVASGFTVYYHLQGRVPRLSLVDPSGAENWAGKDYLDQFFIRPADPETYKP